MESSLTVKFRGAEAELLDRLVRSGLFATKSEALRASLVKYGADLGLLRPRDLWAALDAQPRRRVSAAKLREQVRKAEDADYGGPRLERVPVRLRTTAIELPSDPGEAGGGGAAWGGHRPHRP